MVNSSHGLKAGASLLLIRFCAVIALWHRGAFRGNFRFPFHWPKLTSDSRCRGSDLIGQVRGVPSLLYGIVWRIQNLPEGEVIECNWGKGLRFHTGTLQYVDTMNKRVSQKEANELSVALELQADCYAGVWANRASQQDLVLEPGDVEEGLNAASAVGDDRLQKQSQGYVVPDSFTHGTSAQRVASFRKGLESGDMYECDISPLPPVK